MPISNVPTIAPSTVVSGGSFSIYLPAVTNATGYRVYRSTTSGGTYAQVGTDTTSTTFTDAPPVGTSYFYKYLAFNATGPSNQSLASSPGVSVTAVAPTNSCNARFPLYLYHTLHQGPH